MAKLPTVPLLGIEAVSVDVVVDVAAAMTPKTIPVGLPEAAGVENLEVIPVASLAEAAAFFAGRLTIAPSPSRLQELFQSHSNCAEDHTDVRGQESAKRALVIAATGAHDLLMLGPPGSGKQVDKASTNGRPIAFSLLGKTKLRHGSRR